MQKIVYDASPIRIIFSQLLVNFIIIITFFPYSHFKNINLSSQPYYINIYLIRTYKDLVSYEQYSSSSFPFLLLSLYYYYFFSVYVCMCLQ
jgi:hypothetical protein